MKALLTLIALLTLTACQGNTTTANEEAPEEKRITTIHCETRDGWKEFQTYSSAHQSYGGRNSIWRVRPITGGLFTATNCHAFEEHK